MGKHTTGTAYFVMRCFSFAVKLGGPLYKQLITYVIIGQSGIRGLRSCTVDCSLLLLFPQVRCLPISCCSQDTFCNNSLASCLDLIPEWRDKDGSRNLHEKSKSCELLQRGVFCQQVAATEVVKSMKQRTGVMQMAHTVQAGKKQSKPPNDHVTCSWMPSNCLNARMEVALGRV